MHTGLADPYDYPKRGELERIIFVSGGLRSHYPPIKMHSILKLKHSCLPLLLYRPYAMHVSLGGGLVQNLVGSEELPWQQLL